MTSVIVPPVDLAPGMPSRVVTISATDVTEGGQSMAGQMVRFALSDTLDVTSGGDVIAKTQAEVVLDSNGEGSIRLPVYTDAVKTWCGDPDWAVLVTATWGSQKAVRVPAGTSSIALSSLPPVRPLRGREKLWAITGASITVSEGATAGGSVSLNGGILDLSLRIPRGDWKQPAIISGDIGDVRVEGIYRVQNSSNPTGLPLPAVGVLEVMGTAYPVQRFTSWGGLRVWMRNLRDGIWGDWVELTDGDAGESMSVRAIGLSEHLDDLQDTMVGTQGNTGSATTDRGFPIQSRGVLSVFRMTASIVQQMYVARNGIFVRVLDIGGWNSWEAIGAEPEPIPFPETVDYATERLVRISEMGRRVGVVKTGGKGAVALVYDHGSNAFKDIVLPALQARGLKGTLALNATRLDPEYIYHHYEDEVPWSLIKQWHDDHGIEIANHTKTHTGADTVEQAYDEIVIGRELLEDYAGVRVDSFVGASPHGRGDFDGLSGTTNYKMWYENTAAKMMLGSHVGVTGNMQSPTQTFPMNGQPPIGWRGVWADHGDDRLNIVTDALEYAAQHGERVMVRCHPQNIDGSGDGAITTQQVHDLLDVIKAFVDAGDLVSLTFREWAIAEH